MKNSLFCRVSLVAPLLVLFGCAVGSLETENANLIDTETVGESQQALGSSKPRVDISNWNGLVAMVSDGNYRLTADINASGRTWTPKDFTGTFDGNNKRIYNLTINTNDTSGFFGVLKNAIVRRVRLTNMNVTGIWYVGGLAGRSEDSEVELISVEGTMTAPHGVSVGGIYGNMVGGKIHRSYAKGIVQSADYFAGGLVGFTSSSNLSLATISQSYAQVTVNADTSNTGRTVNAGGIVGSAYGSDIHDVIALGNVTGRGLVGGLVGYLGCGGIFNTWRLYKGIYRGDVVDRNAPGGWAGTVGDYGNCNSRFSNLFWDRTLDPSTNWLSNPEADIAQHRGTTAELRSPTTLTGGIYCAGANDPPRCGDNNFQESDWEAGTTSQHHMLKGMPGPNLPPR